MNNHAISETFKFVEKPSFHVVKNIPPGLSEQIQIAVVDFIASSNVPEQVDLNGFKNQTFQAIASATVLNQGGEFWVGTIDGALVVYVLAHIGNDIDGRLSYHISQAWVRKDYRGNSIVKEWWAAIKKRAKECMCGHLVLTSSRNPKAYERWLGDGLHHYADLLKMTL